MTVNVGTGDLRRALRVQAGRALIAASRHFSRTGARLLGHPSGGAERVVERPPLQIVRDAPARGWQYRPPGHEGPTAAEAQR